MNPTIKRCLSIIGGALMTGLIQAFPQFAVPIAIAAGTLAGAGLITWHDAGHVTVAGVDIGKK